MTSIAVVETQIPDSVSGVLAAARASRQAADAHEVRVFVLAATWADMHSVDVESESAASYFYGPEPIPTSADGLPGFVAWAAADFAANVGLTSEAGTSLIADALETRHRLPRVWARVLAGEVQVWRARRIAQQTTSLSAAGADLVDRHLAFCAHSVGVAQLDRLVEEARARFDPETAEAKRLEATEDRYFAIGHEHISFTGSSDVHGCLDLADALELERAVATGAQELKALGSDDSLDVRRAQAVGVLARGQLALRLGAGPALAGVDVGPVASESPDLQTLESSRVPRGWDTRRRVELVVHTTADAIARLARDQSGSEAPGNHGAIGRCGTSGTSVLMTQVREWLAAPGTKVAVRPVIDLTDVVPVDRYEIPDRMSRAVEERDLVCVFPWCHHRAERCDKDHVVPYDHQDPVSGGETSTANLAPLCRRHHRLKTFGLWGYRIERPGSYIWTDRFGNRYLRDPGGTSALSNHDPGTGPPDTS